MDRLVRHPASDQTAKAPENDQTAKSLEVGTPLLSRTVSPKLCEDGGCLLGKVELDKCASRRSRRYSPETVFWVLPTCRKDHDAH
ncbi:hypothetical protein ACFX2K_028350 [Malus domestica]